PVAGFRGGDWPVRLAYKERPHRSTKEGSRMKSTLFALALSILFAAPSYAEDHRGQCVFPQTVKTTTGRLAFKRPINIFASPKHASAKKRLATFASFKVGAETKDGYIQLIATPGWDAPPNKEAGKIVGWARLADFVFQDLRNCH